MSAEALPSRLGDVADVAIDSPPPIGDAVINDVPGLLLIVEKQPQANTLELTRKVEAAIDSLKPGLRDVEIDPTIFRPATFIERALENLKHALVVGCILVALILILFLFDWRTAVISLAAIPLSLIAALLLFSYSGATINTMVLAGLVIALGEVVDDAIIDVENIARRLRQRSRRMRPSAFQVVLAASLEVRSAVVYASLIVVLVFVPVFFLDGLSGAFFRPLAIAYVIAILASLVVALTVTPALSYMLLNGANASPARSTADALAQECISPDAAAVGRAAMDLSRGSRRRLRAHRRCRHPPRPRVPSQLPGNRFPHALRREARIVDRFDEPRHHPRQPGPAQAEDAEGRKLVRNFGSHIGRAEVADEPVGPNFTELWISIDPDADYQPTVKRIQEIVYGFPGLYRDLLTYLRERIKEVLTGASATIVVRLYGPDHDVLRAKAKEVEAAMKDVPGVVNLKVEPQVLVAQVEVRLRPEAAQKYRPHIGARSPGVHRRSSKD